MKLLIIHHVNNDFTYEVIEKQILFKGTVISSVFSEVKTI